MANRLSFQSSTCSAFQLQRCRQPHKDDNTKTVSSFGSDHSRATQTSHTVPQPDKTSLGFFLFAHCARVCETRVQEREADSYGMSVQERGGAALTVLRWCIPPPVVCTALLPPPRCLPAQTRTGLSSGPGWWQVCPPPQALPLGSPAQ